MKSHLINKIVMQNGDIGTIVGYDKRNGNTYISIRWESRPLNESSKEYRFPDIILNKKWNMEIEEGDSALEEYLKSESDKICINCKTYDPEGSSCDDGFLCKSCLKTYKKCPQCSTYVKSLHLGLDGEQYCYHCLNDKYPPMSASFLDLKHIPTLHIRIAFPYDCTHSHELFNVTAKVATIILGGYAIATINLYYCKNCDKFLITAKMFEDYEKRFGHICLPRNYPDATRFNNLHGFQADTILSRWGYSTTLPTPTRHSILVLMMNSNSRYKADISSILSVFATKRTWQPQAQAIWKEDLKFVDNYNLENQTFIDLTKLDLS